VPVFAAFSANAALDLGPAAADDAFDVRATFTLSANSDGIDPSAERVRLQLGNYSATIPAGSFRSGPNWRVEFEGVIEGVTVKVHVSPAAGHDAGRFTMRAQGQGAHLDRTALPVRLALAIGDDQGTLTLDTVVITARSNH